METLNSLHIFCADLSLRSPGFAVLRFEAGLLTLEAFSHLSLHNSKSCHGERLSAIYDHIGSLVHEDMIFVREKAFSRFAKETQALNKVVGISDLVVWRKTRKVFFEIAPTTVKKALTGSGKADKHAVANAQTPYVGEQAYTTDDESDAVAVGIAWLLQQGYIDQQIYQGGLDK